MPRSPHPASSHSKRRHSPTDKPRRNRVPFYLRIGTGEERDYFIENLGMLFASGMDIMTSLDALRGEVRTKGMKLAIEGVRNDIDAGVPVWRALGNTGLLPDYIVSLLRVGEETGRLPENLKVIVQERQKSRIFRSKIRSAMMYPLLVFLLTFVIGKSIAWFVLPRLATVFGQLNIALPLLTRFLIGLGAFLGEYGAVAIPMVVALVATAFYFVFFYHRTKFVGQAVLFRVPYVQKLVREVELARMGFVLGTLLDAGVPILYALASLRDATQFYAHRAFYSFVATRIEEGNSFQQTFSLFPRARHFVPIPIQEMIAAAEKSGTLSATLLTIGSTFEEKTEITTKNLSILLEPVLLVIVWLGVVGVALAVILPIYSLIGGLNT